MNENERRRHPRHETEIGMTIYTKDEKISGAIVDMGKHGFGLVSEKEIQPSNQVMIALNYLVTFKSVGTGRFRPEKFGC